MQHWIEECHSTHHNCHATRRRPLPTRLVNVGSNKDCREPSLVVSHALEGAQVTYAALSHCWGMTIRTALSLQNMAEMMEGIPWLSSVPPSEMPSSFATHVAFSISGSTHYASFKTLTKTGRRSRGKWGEFTATASLPSRRLWLKSPRQAS